MSDTTDGVTIGSVVKKQFQVKYTKMDSPL